MAQWIDDGYTEVCEVDGWHIEYRPLPLPLLPSVLKRIQCGVLSLEDAVRARLTKDLPTDFLDKQNLWEIVSGYRDRMKTLADERNLRVGVRLFALYPHLDAVSCQTCRTWWFDPLQGTFAMRQGERLKREGAPLCEGGACPVGHYENPRRLSEKNKQALAHYRGCEAVGSFPDDPLVRHHAQIISWAVEKAKADLCP